MRPMRMLYFLSILAYVAACEDRPEKESDRANELSSTDVQFVKLAGQNNLIEIELADLAKSKGTDGAVKSFGDLMVSTHRAAQEELQSIAAQFTNVDLPSEATEPDLKTKQDLARLSGIRFDSAYLSSTIIYQRQGLAVFEQLIDRQRAVEFFQGDRDERPDPGLVEYAEKYQPLVKKHLEFADSLLLAITLQDEGN